MLVIHRSSQAEHVANVAVTGSLLAMRVAFRLLVGLSLAAIIGVSMVPLLVLRDLNSGGTGLGLCDGAVGGCTNSYFAGFELVAALLLTLFLLVALLQLARKALRWSEHKYDVRQSALGFVPPQTPRPSDDTVAISQSGGAGGQKASG